MMGINFKAARDFVHANGTLLERRLFDYHFQGGSLASVHKALAAYQNADGGYGNALEHDLRCPDSNPLALEYLLNILVDAQMEPGSLLDGAAAWVEANRAEDGSLLNSSAVFDYPHAPWWDEMGGQRLPTSLVGNLNRFGKATPDLMASTTRWAEANMSLEKICAEQWLFMLYHPYDFYVSRPASPELADLQTATVERIVELSAGLAENQYYSLLRYLPGPDDPVAKALPPEQLTHVLDVLAAAQQPDGSWLDQHGLAHWYPMVTIGVLHGLKRFGREIGV